LLHIRHISAQAVTCRHAYFSPRNFRQSNLGIMADDMCATTSLLQSYNYALLFDCFQPCTNAEKERAIF